MRMTDETSTTSDDRFHGVFQKLHIGMLIQGPGAEILFSNQAALDLLGLTADQLIGKTSYDANWNVIREDGTPFPSERHPVPVAITTRQSVRNVVMGVYRPKTADRVWLLVNAEPQLAPDGSVRQVVCTFSDITAYRRWEDAQRRLAEDALRKQNQELSALHDTTLDLIDHDDPHSLLEAIVSRAGALLGTADGYLYTVEPAESEPSEQELVARICTGVFTDYKNYRQRPGEGLTGRVLASGQSLVVDDYSTWAGRKFVFNWLHAVAATPLRSGAKIVGVLGLAYMEPGRTFIASEIAQLERFAHLASIVLDNARLYAAAQQELAERKRVEEERIALERQLLEAQKMESLGALAGGMAHDFNNLLQIIVGNAGLARTELFDPMRIQTSLSRIEQAAQQAADLTRQLLAYAGKGRYLIQPLDLDAILTSALQHIQPSLPDLVALRYRAGAPLPAILADETQI